MRGRLVERIDSDGRVHELRRERGLLCLYADGVLHTAYDEEAGISGRVWDLLALGPIALGSGRILVLGVGGGAAIRQMLRFGRVTAVEGVDLDPVHLELARRHFGLDDPRVALHHADALAFVRRCSATFDCIVEDAFAEIDGEPRRAIPLDREWAEALLARLAPEGLLVVNHASRAEVRAGVFGDPAFLEGRGTPLFLETPSAGNVVAILGRTPVDPHSLRARARAALGDAASRLDLRIRSA